MAVLMPNVVVISVLAIISVNKHRGIDTFGLCGLHNSLKYPQPQLVPKFIQTLLSSCIFICINNQSPVDMRLSLMLMEVL